MPTAQEFTDLLDGLILSLHRKIRKSSGEKAQRLIEKREAVETSEELWSDYSREQPERWLAADTLADAYQRLERVIRRNAGRAEGGEHEGYVLVLKHLHKITA